MLPEDYRIELALWDRALSKLVKEDKNRLAQKHLKRLRELNLEKSTTYEILSSVY